MCVRQEETEVSGGGRDHKMKSWEKGSVQDRAPRNAPATGERGGCRGDEVKGGQHASGTSR